MHVCLYVCVYMYVYTYIYIYIYVYVYIYIYIFANVLHAMGGQVRALINNNNSNNANTNNIMNCTSDYPNETNNTAKLHECTQHNQQ